MKLSKEVNRHKNNKDNILTYVKKNGTMKVSMYSAETGIPLIVIWYHIREEFDEHREEARRELERLCKFYRTEIDI